MPHRVFVNYALVFAAAWLAATGGALAQDVIVDAPPGGIDNGALPMTLAGEGNYFSQDLGTILRLRYNTESYGQFGRGNFAIGTMPVWTFDDSAAFFDGQVTLNELQGVGYNFGIGYRQLTNPGISRGAGRVAGVSLWTDGTSTDEGSFFPQIGLSLESLGDMWDLRANGYLPLGTENQVGPFTPTGVIGLQGFSIAELTQAVVSTSYAVADLEAARRLGSERDAWAFAGPYFVGNDDDDAVGYRIGVRGYAYPDLLLQFAVTDDDIFKTNATFAVTWFVGRTRTDFQPTCGVPDRLREPVMRNDYVALTQGFATSGIPLTQPDGSALRIVHVDSDAPEGGDGSFENPFNNLTDINDAGSLEGDIILAHALSVFNGEGSVQLKDNQRLLGEGDGIEHTVNTLQDGIVVIPETFAGARTSMQPQLFGPAPGSDAIILADSNEVNNFIIDGQGLTARAIASPVAGSGNPILRNLDISNTTGDAINLTVLDFIDTEDVDNDTNITERIVRGNLTISDVNFNNIGGDDIDYTGTAVDTTQPNVQLQETISIANVTSNDVEGRGIALTRTHTGGTATINQYTYDGGTTGDAGIELTNIDGTVTVQNSTLTEGSTSGFGARVLGDSDGAVTFANTTTFNLLSGTAFEIDGTDAGVDSLGGVVTVNSAITTPNSDTARSVVVRNVTTTANIDFNGNITDQGIGILVEGNSGGTITFQTGNLDLDIDTIGADAVRLSNNTGATIEFIGPVDITSTNGADGLIATGGGTLRYSNTANSVRTDSGQVARIEGMTIQAGNGVVISDVNRTTAAATAAIFLEDNTGGPITLGNVADAAPGDSGTLVGGNNANTVVISDSANVTISNVIIQNGADGVGINIDKTTSASSSITLNDLIINDGDRGINAAGAAGAGALTFQINDTQILDSTEIGLAFDDVDTGSMTFVNLDIDGNNAAAAARGVLINRSNASFNFDVNSSVADFLGTTFQVNEAGAGNTSSGNITFAGDIINNGAGDTAGRSVVIQRVTGGTVNFTSASSIDDANDGILVTNNSGGTISFNGDNNLNTDSADAVTLTNNTGATINFTNLDIDTTSGRGLVATGGGTLAVTGATNTIDTTTGVALELRDMTIAAGGVTFQKVNVNGATNGIILEDLTGGQVAVGTTTGDASVLTTVGDTIVLENVVNADFNNVDVNSSGGRGVFANHVAANTNSMDITFNDLNLIASSGLGIDVNADGTQTFNLRINNSTIAESVDMDSTGTGAFKVLLDNTDITTTGADVALSILFDDTADGDLTIRNGSQIVAQNARALDITVTGGGTAVAALIESSTFTSATAEDLNLFNDTGAQTDATIRNNTFANSAVADDVVILSNGSVGAGTRLDLNLVNNGLPASTISLETLGAAAGTFNFGVVDRDNANANNPANVTFTPIITDFEDIAASAVELPNGP